MCNIPRNIAPRHLPKPDITFYMATSAHPVCITQKSESTFLERALPHPKKTTGVWKINPNVQSYTDLTLVFKLSPLTWPITTLLI